MFAGSVTQAEFQTLVAQLDKENLARQQGDIGRTDNPTIPPLSPRCSAIKDKNI